MVKLYFIQSLIFAAFVYQLPFSAEAQTSPSDYFRSASSGFWNSTSSWESSPDGATNWIPATMGPTSTANTILIRNGHLITIATNTVADQVVVQSGGTLELGTAASTFLTINDGTGSDIIIESGGIFRHNIAAGSQLPSFTGTAVMEIRSGGVLEVENSNGFPSDYANSNSSISPNIIWSDGSVFNWNSLTSPADGITYFPSAADIPIFRVSKPITIGNTASTIINGLLEATATVSLSSTGAKTFRNGIIGNATVTATAINGGQILINGSAAKLGGGQLVLNNNGLAIASNTTVNMVSNKSINNFSGSTGTVTVSGTLTCDDYLIDGTSKIQVDGTLKTTNVNGLTGGSNTTFVTGFGVNTFGSTSTIEYNRPGDQAVTPLSYSNLTISGTGTKNVVAAADVVVTGTLNISANNAFTLNGTNHLKLNGGGTLNVNANATFDTGGESQVSGGGTPTINIYGTFITRDAQGFAGTNASIPGATSSPTITLKIYPGSTVEYGRAGDQAVSSRSDYYNLTFSGSGVKTIPTCIPLGTVTVKDNAIADASNKNFGDANTNLTMTGGRLKVGGSGTSPDIGGTYNLTGGDIEFTNVGATAQTIRSPRTYFNIIVSGSNVRNSAGTITLASGGSFTVKTSGTFENNSNRIDGVTGVQSFTMETGSTFKTGVAAGLSGNASAAPFPALNNIESFNIHPKSTIIYSRLSDQVVTPLAAGYPTLLLKGSGLKTVTTGVIDISAAADSVVIDPLVVFKVSSGAKANLNNRSVFIHSNAAGTGAIGEITDGASALLNATNVTSERFIPAKRAFRFLSSAVTTTTSIKANWMEGQSNPPPAYSVNYNNNPGYGTHITGSSDASDGFDATTLNNPSLFTHNNNSQVWQAVTNTNAVIGAGSAYRLNVRGSRSVDLRTNNATPSNTILRTKGSLLAGTIVYNSTSNPYISSSIDNYSFVGNPYASPVDWEALQKQDLSPYYSVWDPTLNARGAYVTYGNGITNPASSQVNQHIQSGQAFFVQTKGANPSLTFNETNKSNVNRNVFKTTFDITRLSVELLLDTTAITDRTADGVTVLFDESYSAGISNEDAGKFINLDENMWIVSKGTALTIEGRPPVASSDTINLQMKDLKHNSYYLKFQPASFSPSASAAIKDNYLNKETPISLSTESLLAFSLTSEPQSSSPDRFSIIFKSNVILPLTACHLKAFQKEDGFLLQWNVQQQSDIEKYEVERSHNGHEFTKIAAVTNETVIVIANHTWFDSQPNEGNNFYRIKMIEKSGHIKYSNIVVLSTKKSNTGITVFPNPVTGNTFNVRMNNLPKGNYTIAVYNDAGQKVTVSYLSQNGTTSTHTIRLNKRMNKGNYKLQFTGMDTVFTRNLQVQ